MNRTKTSLETLANDAENPKLWCAWTPVACSPCRATRRPLDCCWASRSSCAATVHTDHIGSYRQNSRAWNRNKIHQCQHRILCWIAQDSVDGETAWSAAVLGSVANVPALRPDDMEWFWGVQISWYGVLLCRSIWGWKEQGIYFTINFIFQAVCDENMLFLDIVAGWPGSVHDSRVLRWHTSAWGWRLSNIEVSK